MKRITSAYTDIKISIAVKVFSYALWILHTNMAIAYSTQGHKLSG